MAKVHPYCICTTVAQRALKSLLETSGRGSYRTSDPFLIARNILKQAHDDNAELAILFATGQPLEFSHWAFVSRLEVVELHRGTFETECEFATLAPVNPIWSPIDSLFLKPSQEQLDREALEGIHQHRHALTEGEIHPYAICETPGFLLEST